LIHNLSNDITTGNSFVNGHQGILDFIPIFWMVGEQLIEDVEQPGRDSLWTMDDRSMLIFVFTFSLQFNSLVMLEQQR
jgi:hypothetical protein